MGLPPPDAIPMPGLAAETCNTMIGIRQAITECLLDPPFGYTETLSVIPVFPRSEDGDTFRHTQTSWLSYGGLD